MQFGGKLTEADLNDVRKMTRSKVYWLRFVTANLYRSAIILVLLWATISGFAGQTKPNWGHVAIIWAAMCGLVLWAIYRTKRKRERELADLNAALPDRINVTNDGVKLDGPNGATGSMPWASFKGWREGQRVVLLDQRQGNRFVILPVANLSEIERLSIRQNLQSQIPPTK